MQFEIIIRGVNFSATNVYQSLNNASESVQSIQRLRNPLISGTALKHAFATVDKCCFNVNTAFILGTGGEKNKMNDK